MNTEKKIDLINKIINELKNKFVYTNTFIGFSIKNFEKSITIDIDSGHGPIFNSRIETACSLIYSITIKNEENEVTLFLNSNDKLDSIPNESINILLYGLQRFLFELNNHLDKKIKIFKKTETEISTKFYLKIKEDYLKEIN